MSDFIFPTHHQIATQPFKFKEFNLYELQPNDLQVYEYFYLEWVLDGHIEMLFVFFEVEFRATHRPIRISTSPMEPKTSYLQNVFQLEHFLTGKRGERFFGTITMAERGKVAKGAEPRRQHTSDMDDDLEVTFDIAYEGAFGQSTQNDLIYTVR